MNADEINLLEAPLFARREDCQLFWKLRAEAPVFFHEEPNGAGFHLVTQHNDVVGVVGNAVYGLSRSSRSIRKRRNWLAISRLPAANGVPKAIRRKCGRPTS